MKQRLTRYDIAFLIPGLTVFILFMLIPLSLSLFYGFTNWNGIRPTYSFIGFRNFSTLLYDRNFWDSFWNTLVITGITTFLVNVIGILLAVIIEPKSKVNNFAKTMVFIPAILSGVVVSFIWAYMTQTQGGIINTILQYLRIPTVDFYSSKQSIILMVSSVISWATLGFFTTVYIANITTLPIEVYEAAHIDGAGKVRIFCSITLPLLKPAIIINTTTAIVWGLKQFDFVKVMIPGYIQTVTIYAVERAFEYNMFGYSSAIILVMLLFTIGISIIQMQFLRRKEVHYS